MLSALTNYINDNFGSKKGVLNQLRYKFLFRLGFYGKYKKIDFSKVERLVFICSGNICRSSFAEYAAKSFGLAAQSYGLHCRGGDGADPRAIRCGKYYGLDLGGHITRNIKDYVPGGGDLIVVMEPRHLVELKEVMSTAQATIATLWAKSPSPYLHDPYSASEAFFDECEGRLWSAVERLSGHV